MAEIRIYTSRVAVWWRWWSVSRGADVVTADFELQPPTSGARWRSNGKRPVGTDVSVTSPV
jgi:hypothetical protein